MAPTARCSSCGASLASDEVEGACTRCFLAMALAPARDYSMPQIPRYQILRLIGAGGMGEVYEAEQEHPRRIVALKLIKRGLAAPRLMRRFEDEAEVLGRLQHPGIAQVYESGATDSGDSLQPYFAMELVHGPTGQTARSLTQYAREQRLTIRQRLALMATVADAVHYAHQKGVIHRDLKPGNILVDESGQPKIVDFGVARLTDLDVQATTAHTDIGQIIGTLAYMSPEQAAGDPAELDIRADIYALGAICYELLAGRLPYELDGRGVLDALRVIREQEPARLGSLDRQLRGDIETIVAKSLAKEKERRYQSAAELAADIRRYLDDEPISARPPSAGYQLGKFARRNKALVGGAAAVVVVLLLGIAGTSWQAIRASRATVQMGRSRNDALAAESAARLDRDKAQRRFDDVRKLAMTFMRDFHSAIRDLPGSTKARQMLVKTSLEYMDKLGQEAENNISLQRELAGTYEEVAAIQGNPNTANLGDTAGALATNQKAAAIFGKLIAARPDDDVLKIDLAQCHGNTADVLAWMGRTEEALVKYREGEQLLKQVAPRRPDDLVVQRLLGHLYNEMARILIHAGGRTSDAVVYAQQGFLIHKRLADAAPEDAAAQLALAESLIVTGDLMAEMGEPARAIKTYEKSLVIAEFLLRRDPNNSRFEMKVAIDHQRIGDVQGGPAGMNLGDPAASLKNYEKALAIFQRQWEADRVNRGAVVNLAIVHLHIGDALLAMKKLPEALKSYRQGLPHMEHLVKEDDANAMYKHNLFAFHERIGVIEAQIGTPPDALAQFHAALEIAQGLVRASPGNAQFQNNLAIVNLRVATVAAETGEGADAVAHSRSGLKIMQDLARLDPNSAEALRNLRTAYHDIGQVYELLGGNNAEPVSKQTEDIQSARSFYNDGLALTARLTKAGILRADDALSQELKEGVQWCDEAIKALSAR